MWNLNVYGTDYPLSVISIIPDIDEDNAVSLIYNISEADELFKIIFKHSPPYVRNYIFNPQYSDYPVIGVSWLQASKYNKWLADRYNEYILVKRKYLEFSYDQFSQRGAQNIYSGGDSFRCKGRTIQDDYLFH